MPQMRHPKLPGRVIDVAHPKTAGVKRRSGWVDHDPVPPTSDDESDADGPDGDVEQPDEKD